MATHTESPWVVNYDPEDGRPLEIVSEADRDRRVAFLASDGQPADAKLLAAAPDLVAALHRMLREWDALPPFRRPAKLIEAADKARVALAKAGAT
jgi:hypothetical protein